MRHIFFIHSQITSLITKAIICEKNINHKNCVIITLDIYEKNIIHRYFPGIKIFSFSITNFKKNNFGTIRKELALYFWINLKTLFSSYVFYTIHDKVFLSKYISNNFRCKKYYYIEEGLGSFFKENYSNYIQNENNIYRTIQYFLPFRIPYYLGKRKIRINKILPEVTFFEPLTLYSRFNKLHGAFKISDNAFPFIDKSILVKSDIKNNENLNILEAPFFVFDNLIASKICSFEVLSEVFYFLILKENIKALNIKFHPLQPENEIAEWKKILLKKNIKYYILDNQTVLEEHVGSNNFTFYGFVSSLLYYNVKLSQHEGKSYTYLKKIYELENKEIPEYYKNVLSFFEQNGITVQ